MPTSMRKSSMSESMDDGNPEKTEETDDKLENPEKTEETKRLLFTNHDAVLTRAKAVMKNAVSTAKQFDVGQILLDLASSGSGTLCASELRASRDGKTHFAVKDISQKTKKVLLAEYLPKLFNDLSERIRVDRIPPMLASFGCDMMKSLASLEFQLDNEASVRFAFGDPLVKLLSDFGEKYKVCTSLQSVFVFFCVSFVLFFVSNFVQVKLECQIKDTFGEQLSKSAESLSGNLRDSVTITSRMDYAITTVNVRDGPVFFIMEAKRSPLNIDDAIAQVCTFCTFALLTKIYTCFCFPHPRPLATI